MKVGVPIQGWAPGEPVSHDSQMGKMHIPEDAGSFNQPLTTVPDWIYQGDDPPGNITCPIVKRKLRWLVL